jgi:hypothetical protein
VSARSGGGIVVSGIEAAAGRVAGRAALWAGRQLLENRRWRRLSETARTMIPARTADELLSELDADQQAALADFLESPDFEHLAMQIVLALPLPEQAEIMVEMRSQILQCIRTAVAVAPEQLTGLTDVVFDALTVACRAATMGVGRDPQAATGITVAVQSHLAAMAARNGRLLARLSNRAEIWDAATRLRQQVRTLRGRIHLSHTGVNRSVPWDRLFVVPALRLVHSGAGNGEQAVPVVEELVEPGRRTVLLGDPGAGKSTLAAKLAYDVAVGPEPRTPFLVILRDLAEALRIGDRTFVDCLALAGRAPYGVNISTDGIEYLIMNGRAVVVVDGLDELTDLSLRGRMVQILDGFATLYPLVPIIVTSRQVGYAESALNPDLFHSYVLAPFDVERVQRYARHWFDLDDGTPVEDRRARCEMFLRESETISDLRANPLLLSLLCAGYASERYIPKNRAQVYERCATTLFDRWDSMRGVSMPLRFHGHVRGAVLELAWQMLVARNVSVLPRRKVLAILCGYLVAKRIDEDEAQALAEGFLAFCAGRAWILAEVGTEREEPVYGFVHRTFLEYFAAEYLVRHHTGPDAAWTALAPRLDDASWIVTAQLVLQLVDRNVDDGGESLVDLALSELQHAALERRFNLTAFLARAVGHLSLSRPTLDRIVGAAIEDTRTIDVDDRYRYWAGEEIYQLARRCDRPFHDLLYLSLGTNLPDLRRSIDTRLGAAAETGDESALYLIHNLTRCQGSRDEERIAYWNALEDELRHRYASGFATWWQRRAWGRLWGTDDDPAIIEDMVSRFGVAPFYTGDVYAGGLTAPGIVILLTDRDSPDRRPGTTAMARALRDHLLRRSTPWIPAGEWWPQLAAIDAELERWMAQHLYAPAWPGGEDLGTFVVLCLPYLESAEKLRDQGFVEPAAALVRARIRCRETGQVDGETMAALPESCRGLVEEWIRGLSTVGP